MDEGEIPVPVRGLIMIDNGPNWNIWRGTIHYRPVLRDAYSNTNGHENKEQRSRVQLPASLPTKMCRSTD